jgi:6-pyruvoyltetrahydropterin/6-carboxytetrahydropterin synthase
MKVRKQFRFEASHQVRNDEGRCSRLHGHSWTLTVAVEGAVSAKSGMVINFFDIKAAVQPMIDLLDHQHFGSGIVQGNYIGPSIEVEDLPLPTLPTTENMLLWMGRWLSVKAPEFCWHSLNLQVTATSGAELTYAEFVKN